MRQYGILLHISSLPSAYGIGDLGPAAYAFADTLKASEARLWQFLPLQPTEPSQGNSPYASPSAFAGNLLFVSPERLVVDGWLTEGEMLSIMRSPTETFSFQEGRVHFELVTEHRERLLEFVFEKNVDTLAKHTGFRKFCKENEFWLHDYARFVCIKRQEGGRAWTDWPSGLKDRAASSLKEFDMAAARSLERVKFGQYLFSSQWQALRAHCNKNDITLVGDIPMYVTHDSADVWSHREFFELDKYGKPTSVAGVPPDYFSETGQRWGNPVYCWNVMKKDDFSWWKERFEHAFRYADILRLDHFRGFCGYWAIPADEETAINGQWRSAPGKAFMKAMQKYFPDMPFIAENLGIMTRDVYDLMEKYHLPGMHVLQFAFSSPLEKNPDIPYRHTKNSVVYTGTHDNMTTRQWVLEACPADVENLCIYTGRHAHYDSVVDVMTRVAFTSVADTVIIPAQDALSLGAQDRMNTPGTCVNNWEWRLPASALHVEHYAHLAELACLFARRGVEELDELKPTAK